MTIVKRTTCELLQRFKPCGPGIEFITSHPDPREAIAGATLSQLEWACRAFKLNTTAAMIAYDHALCRALVPTSTTSVDAVRSTYCDDLRQLLTTYMNNETT